MKKTKIFCLCIILAGIGLFVTSYFFIPSTAKLFGWCLGLGSSLIILGLGYLINAFLLTSEQYFHTGNQRISNEPYKSSAKERSGYLVCKIMNLLLCIYLLVLNKIACDRMIIILTIVLILIQYFLDLFIQIYLLTRSSKNKKHRDT